MEVSCVLEEAGPLCGEWLEDGFNDSQYSFCKSAMGRYNGSAWVPLFLYLGKQVVGPWGGFLRDDLVEFLLEWFGEGLDDILTFLDEL